MNLFKVKKALIGVVHVHALPGTPCHTESMADIVRHAVIEAKMLEKAGFHGIIIENMFDRPYVKAPAAPEIIAAMTAVSVRMREAVKVPLGIQVLASANQEALAIALAADLQFIRAEGFVFAHVADEGYTESCAGALLRYRKAIGAAHIQVFTDIKKKHSAHAITSDVDIAETAHAAAFFLSDAMIVTGAATGLAAALDEVKAVKEAVATPVLIGSGITPQNLKTYFDHADGFIIGSALKNKGQWDQPLNPAALAAMMQAYDALSGSLS